MNEIRAHCLTSREAATCGIYGIRNAGLAVCVGTWSSCQVVTSFIFGILIFKEEVKSVYHTAFAFFTLAIGLVGMSTFSKPATPSRKPKAVDVGDSENDERPSTMKRKAAESSSISARKPPEMELLVAGDGESKGVLDQERIVLFCGRVALTKRQLGIVGAVINGLWGGLSLIPLHYAQQEGFGGAAFLVSYACGSANIRVSSRKCSN